MHCNDGTTDSTTPDQAFAFDQEHGGSQFELRPAQSAVEKPVRVHVAAGYRRCREFDAKVPGGKQQPGQDFCTFRIDEHHAVGVVADGVGQSFFGDIAARVAGRALIDFLWTRRANPPTDAEFSAFLNEQQPILADEVERKTLSDDLDPFLLAALMETKHKDGSQTVLGAVVLDLQARAANIYLLGDIIAIVHDASPTPWPWCADKHGRWASTDGIKGSIERETLSNVEAIMLKSDGAGPDWGLVLDDVVQHGHFVARAEQWAERDDVSFVLVASRGIELALPAPPVAVEPDSAVEPPPHDEPNTDRGPAEPRELRDAPPGEADRARTSANAEQPSRPAHATVRTEPTSRPFRRYAPRYEVIPTWRLGRLSIGITALIVVGWLLGSRPRPDWPAVIAVPIARSDADPHALMLGVPKTVDSSHAGHVRDFPWSIKPPVLVPDFARHFMALRGAPRTPPSEPGDEPVDTPDVCSAESPDSHAPLHVGPDAEAMRQPPSAAYSLLLALIDGDDSTPAARTLSITCSASGDSTFHTTIELVHGLTLLDHRFARGSYRCSFASGAFQDTMEFDLNDPRASGDEIACYLLTIAREDS